MSNNLSYKPFYRRHLPHIQPPGATIFVTFRLVNSIPAHVMHHLLTEAKETDIIVGQIRNLEERKQRAYLEQRRLFGKWDKALHTPEAGPTWLQHSEVAALVAASIHFRDSKSYELEAFCIMPNHLHLVFTPLRKDDGTYHALSTIMHSLKLYTGRQANDILKREGQFWQHESYDHVIRDEAERKRIINYTINNPVKAGLVDHWEEWPWTHCKYL